MARNQRPRPTAEDRKNTQVGCGILLVALLVVGGCSALINGDDDSSSGSSSSSSVHDGSSGSGGGAASVTVGDFVGMELQTAQDAAQGDGIHALDSTDATGQGRMQLLDRNWTVCAQTPAAGETMSTDDTLTFDTVKSSEGRPAVTSRRRAAATAAATTARTTPPLPPARGMTGATTTRPPSPVPGTTTASTPPAAAPVHRQAAPTRPRVTPMRPRPHLRPRAARRRRPSAPPPCAATVRTAIPRTGEVRARITAERRACASAASGRPPCPEV